MFTPTILDRRGTSDEALALRADLVARARALRPLLARNAAQTEADRCVAEENVVALRDAGLFRVLQPKRFGGSEADIRTIVEVTSELARSGCGSTAWVTAIMNGGALLTGQMLDQCQRDIWGEDPDNLIATSFDPQGTSRRVDGGWLVSGKWAWASGSLQAQWFGMGFPISLDDSGSVLDVRVGYAPMSELTIEDTWFVAGMKGTGSNTVVAHDVFIPDHRTSDPKEQALGNYSTEHKDEVLYRSPLNVVAATGIIGAILGLAVAALDVVIDKAPNRKITYTTYRTQVDAPSVQYAVARASRLIDSAFLNAYLVAGELDQCAADDVRMDYEQRARLTSTFTNSVVQAREAVDILMSAHGASAFSELSPLQRIWRDVETGSRHAVLNADIAAEVYGRVLLGVEERISVIV